MHLVKGLFFLCLLPLRRPEETKSWVPRVRVQQTISISGFPPILGSLSERERNFGVRKFTFGVTPEQISLFLLPFSLIIRFYCTVNPISFHRQSSYASCLSLPFFFFSIFICFNASNKCLISTFILSRLCLVSPMYLNRCYCTRKYVYLFLFLLFLTNCFYYIYLLLVYVYNIVRKLLLLFPHPLFYC